MMDLVPGSDPILRRPAQPFDFSGPVDSYDMADRIEGRLRELGGMGLAAPQIGIPLAVFSLAMDPMATIFNPHVVDLSEETIRLDEGCLSFPGIFLRIRRPRRIKIRFQLKDGEHHTAKFDGVTARTILHEIDHLDGVPFTHRASRTALDVAVRRARKIGYNYRVGELLT